MFDFIKKRIPHSIIKGEVIGIDLGTENTILYLKSKGVLINEPSCVAVIKENGANIPYLYGKKAHDMLGKTPINISVVKPMQDGVISDALFVEKMLEYFISIVKKEHRIFKYSIVISVPFGATPVDIATIQLAAERCGAKEVYLVYESVVAALGCGLPINDSFGSFVVDIGGGTTETSVLSLGGIVCADAIKCASNHLRRDIVDYIKQTHCVVIGDAMARKIHETIGVACLIDGEKDRDMIVMGRDIKSGSPVSIKIKSSDVSDAISGSIGKIIELIKNTLERMPPELSSDIFNRGVVLTGGGALLKNLDYFISRATNLSVFVAQEPLNAVIRGIGLICENLEDSKNFLFIDNYF